MPGRLSNDEKFPGSEEKNCKTHTQPRMEKVEREREREREREKMQSVSARHEESATSDAVWMDPISLSLSRLEWMTELWMDSSMEHRETEAHGSSKKGD